MVKASMLPGCGQKVCVGGWFVVVVCKKVRTKIFILFCVPWSFRLLAIDIPSFLTSEKRELFQKLIWFG